MAAGWVLSGLGAAVAAALVALAVTGAWYRAASLHGIVDIPNLRSSHARIVPTGGGVGICAGVAAGIIVLTRSLGPVDPALTTLLLCAAAIAAVGFVDDARGLGPVPRLLVQLSVASVLIAQVGPLRRIDLFGASLELGLLAVPLSLVWIVGVTNAYNFMDGIDGLAAGQGVLAGLALFVAAGTGGAVGLAGLALVVATACAGYLAWNFPPARIFMGDVGSGTLGFLFAGIGLVGSRRGTFSLMVVVLCLGAFLFDTTFTLARRIQRGELWYRAHRSHVYQRYVGVGFSHLQVTSVEYLAMALLAIAALLYPRADALGQGILLVLWIGAGFVAVLLVERLEKR